MAKSNGTASAQASHDFFKQNGSDTTFRDSTPSLTRQEFLEECDINALMKRYEGVGTGPGGLPRAPDLPPFYADFTTMPTNLLEYMTMMDEAQAAFMTLPATVRRDFENSPMHFVDFASDPANIGKMREWGLAPPAPAKPLEPAAAPAAGGQAPAPQAPSGAPGGPSTHGST